MQNPDSLHRLGVLAFRRGDASLWVLALAAYRLEDVTGLANELPVSGKHLYRLASGYAYWKALVVSIRQRDALPDLAVYELRKLRQALTITHFIRLGELARRYGFDAFEAREYLRTAAHDAISVGHMVEAVEGEYGDDDRPDWKRAAGEARTLIGRILDDNEAPEPWRKWAEAGRALVEELE